MKTVKLIAKIVAALAAVAGIVYIIAAYGDKIVAWAKKLLGRGPCCDAVCNDCDCIDPIEDAVPEEEEAEPDEVSAAEDAGTVTASDADFDEG